MIEEGFERERVCFGWSGRAMWNEICQRRGDGGCWDGTGVGFKLFAVVVLE